MPPKNKSLLRSYVLVIAFFVFMGALPKIQERGNLARM